MTNFEGANPFPVDALPEPLRGFVAAVAQSKQCDLAVPGLSSLAACAAAIGNARVVQIKPDWSEACNLWVVVVAASGTGKTPAMRAVLQPLRELQHDLIRNEDEIRRRYEVDMHEYRRNLRTWKKGGNGDPPAEPLPPPTQRILVADVTIAALAPLLQMNSRGLCVALDEIDVWIERARGHDLQSWLSLHTGEPMMWDRGSGKMQSVYVPRGNVTLMGGIQPRILQSRIDLQLRASGLLARVLFAFTTTRTTGWTDQAVSLDVAAKYAMLVRDLYALPMQSTVDGYEPMPVRLDSEAIELFAAFVEEQADLCAGFDEDRAAASQKLVGYAARFALIIHLIRQSSGERDVSVHIDAASMNAALELARWSWRESCRVYDFLDDPSHDALDDDAILRIIKRKGGRITANELRRLHRAIKTTSEAEALLDRLVAKGYGSWKDSEPGSPGRRTRYFVLADSVSVSETTGLLDSGDREGDELTCPSYGADQPPRHTNGIGGSNAAHDDYQWIKVREGRFVFVRKPSASTN